MLRFSKILLSALIVSGLILSVGVHSAGAQNKLFKKEVIERIFSETEKALITEYYKDKFGTPDKAEHDKKKHKKDKSLPPGLAKKDSLPPGLARHIAKNGKLPAGLEKRALPDDLLNRLPKDKPGTKRIIVGNDIILIDEGTAIILDVFKGVVLGE